MKAFLCGILVVIVIAGLAVIAKAVRELRRNARGK